MHAANLSITTHITKADLTAQQYKNNYDAAHPLRIVQVNIATNIAFNSSKM